METEDKFLGCMYGLAIGDAIGYQTEFMRLKSIRETYGPLGVLGFHSIPRYSDDTQMSFATAQALIKSQSNDLDSIMHHISREYIEWMDSPENNRAPGETCMAGVENLKRGVCWKESGIKESKGCGAAMRTAPIGLYFSDNFGKLEEVAYAASICTHAHPTGVAAGIGTAYLTALALNNKNPENVISSLEELGKKYDVDFTNKITQIRDVLNYSDTDKAIQELGEGWVGEEAVALALYCFLKNPEDYKKTVLMAANTNGDSDSIACIAGAISGAYNGISAIPVEWIRDIENTELIRDTGSKLYDGFKRKQNNSKNIYLFATPVTDVLFGFRKPKTELPYIPGETNQEYVLKRKVEKLKKFPPNFAEILVLDRDKIKQTDLSSSNPRDYQPTSPEQIKDTLRKYFSRTEDKVIVAESSQGEQTKKQLEELVRDSNLERRVVLIKRAGYNEQLVWNKPDL